MRALGIALLVIGTVVALVAAAGPLEENALRGVVGCGLFLMALGVVVRREGSRRAAVLRGKEGGPRRSLEAAERIAASTANLHQTGAEMGGPALREALRTILEPSRTEFHDHSQAILDGYGVLVWSEVVGNFARGERWLHRAESAAADGDDAEARDAVATSLPWFQDCARQLREALESPVS